MSISNYWQKVKRVIFRETGENIDNVEIPKYLYPFEGFWVIAGFIVAIWVIK